MLNIWVPSVSSEEENEKAHRFLFFKIGESESFEKRDLLEDTEKSVLAEHTQKFIIKGPKWCSI